MNFRERVTAEYEKRKGELLVFVLLLGFGFFINRGVELKGLYMDDLYLWSCYGEQSFREFVFPVGGTRFRFIFYLAAWLELLFLGGHVALMVRSKAQQRKARGELLTCSGISPFQTELLSDQSVLRSDGESGSLGGGRNAVLSVSLYKWSEPRGLSGSRPFVLYGELYP